MISVVTITERKQQKRQGQFNYAFPKLENGIGNYFLKNFLLPYPANPIRPEPSRSMVEGSGTADTAIFGPKIPSDGNPLGPSGKTRIGDGSIVFTRSPLKVALNDMLLVAP